MDDDNEEADLRSVFFGTALVAALGSQLSWSQEFIPYQDERAVERGMKVYQEQCASCHGADLGGQENWQQRDENGLLPAPPHDETGHTWHHPDLLLFQITKFGTAAVVGDGYESNMPGFAEMLSDAQILETLAYIKSTWPDRVKAVQTNRSQQ